MVVDDYSLGPFQLGRAGEAYHNGKACKGLKFGFRAVELAWDFCSLWLRTAPPKSAINWPFLGWLSGH